MTPSRNGPASRPTAPSGIVAEVAHVREDPCSAPGDLATVVGETEAWSAAFDKLDAHGAFQFLDLHGKRRLRHGAVLGRAAKMAETRHGIKVAKLPQAETSISFPDHGHI